MKNVSFLLAILFFISTTTYAQQERQATEGYEIGSIATDFSLKNIDDQMVSLENFEEAEGFIICFTCNHCPFSVANEARLISIDERYKEQGYPVIAINPNDPEVNEDDSFEKMKERASERGFTFPYLFDEGQKIFPQYGATKTPHIYLLKKTDAGLKVMYMGAIDNSARDEEEVTETYLEDALNALIAGEEIELKETKAIGCGIKVKKP